jgi:hypothetical protein
MREQLVGHLLGALDPDESKDVELALADPQSGPALRRDLDCLRRAMLPLEADRDRTEPPPGLARRTLERIARERAAAAGAPSAPQRSARPLPTPHEWDNLPRRGRGRAWVDRAIIAATALAACVLVAPLLLDSIAQSRARRAERNLMRTSGALQGYAEAHRVFPTPPDAGPLSRAGLYAPTLVSDLRLVADDGTLLAPDSELSRSGTFRVPSLEEMKAAVGTPGFEELVRAMGGDYGYTLGHRDPGGTLRANVNRRRRHHPLMADAPDHTAERSANHADGAHHVLFEDGHVRRIHGSELHVEDHLFRNHDGRVAAGVDEEDAVIGDSHDMP